MKNESEISPEKFREFLASNKNLPEYFVEIALEEANKEEVSCYWMAKTIEHIKFIESFIKK